MPCFRPYDVWPAVPPAKGIVFSPMRSYAGAKGFSIPCGQCMGCRLDKARDWSTRLSHEASLHEANSFLTLTFAAEHLPEDHSVHVRDVQLFMKRLRKAVGRVRFFACGEYGDKGGRPHYHLLVFGHDFPDKTPWRKTGSGHVVYRSAALEKLWPFGHAEIGTVTVQSAGYVARYITKKVTGEAAEDHYSAVHPADGQPFKRRPEFIVMSTRPGIGAGWYDEFKDDAFPSDFVVIEGRKTPVPRYYKKKLSELEALKVTAQRKENAALHADNNTTTRLMTREESQQLRADRLVRNMEIEP
jgi:hypothetical protein